MSHPPIELKPFVSIIIPTYNRVWSLGKTVESFVSQSYPQDRYEIILCDNGSTDDTRQIIAELAVAHANVVRMSERRRGAHFARNSAAMRARGEILYFTDDDMVAAADLLEKIVTGFQLDPKVGAVTGRVLPMWEAEPPGWVLDYCRNSLLSLNDRGEMSFVSDNDPGVFSCHEAILRDVFFQAGGFNPDTNAGEFTGDNETGLNIKVKALDYRFAYVGEATIHHVIPASRMTQRYLNGRFADQGFSDGYSAYKAAQMSRAHLLGRVAAHSVRALASSSTALARRAMKDSRWRLHLARVFYHVNRARYDMRLASHAEWRNFVTATDWLSDNVGNNGRVVTGARNRANG